MQDGLKICSNDFSNVKFVNLCTFALINDIVFGKNQQLASLNPVPILIAQTFSSHDISLFLWINNLFPLYTILLTRVYHDNHRDSI